MDTFHIFPQIIDIYGKLIQVNYLFPKPSLVFLWIEENRETTSLTCLFFLMWWIKLLCRCRVKGYLWMWCYCSSMECVSFRWSGYDVEPIWTQLDQLFLKQSGRRKYFYNSEMLLTKINFQSQFSMREKNIFWFELKNETKWILKLLIVRMDSNDSKDSWELTKLCICPFWVLRYYLSLVLLHSIKVVASKLW